MKAIVMFSGGLDSTLALRIIQNMGIDVLALHFSSPFAVRREPDNSIEKVASGLGVRLRKFFTDDEYMRLLKYPVHGYGRNANPCIDCRIYQFKKAKQIMEETQSSFIVTGEVLAQRPMSQHRRAIETIERKAGLEGLILRPLSAKLFSETIPEKSGWVNREKLFAFNGRSRAPQMALASKLGITDYPSPAGGCQLTDPGFSRRAKDLMEYGALDANNIELLMEGRHFRINPNYKLIVGRNEIENAHIESLVLENDLFFDPAPFGGPSAIGRGDYNEDVIRLSVAIIGRYMKNNRNNPENAKNPEIGVSKGKNPQKAYIPISKISAEELPPLLI